MFHTSAGNFGTLGSRCYECIVESTVSIDEQIFAFLFSSFFYDIKVELNMCLRRKRGNVSNPFRRD